MTKLDMGQYSGREFDQQQTAQARYDAMPADVDDALQRVGMCIMGRIARIAELEHENAELRALAIHDSGEGTHYYYRDQCEALQEQLDAYREQERTIDELVEGPHG